MIKQEPAFVPAVPGSISETLDTLAAALNFIISEEAYTQDHSGSLLHICWRTRLIQLCLSSDPYEFIQY